MPESPSKDRFGDLGPGDGRSAAERLAELDETRPEPQAQKPPEPARPRGRYTWVVGVAAIILIVIVVLALLGFFSRGRW